MNHLPPMRAFDELTYGFCTDGVVARLIHCWAVPNLQGNEAAGVEFLFIDTKGETMHSFASEDHISKYQQMLEPNSTYRFNSFMVIPARAVHQVSDNPYSIRFTENTIFVKVDPTRYIIDGQRLRLRDFEELYEISDGNGHLFDVLGIIRVISTDMADPNVPVSAGMLYQDRVFLHLHLEHGETVRVNIWNEIATSFRSRWIASEPKPKVLLLTTINPKTFAGALVLNSTASTRFFFDNDITQTANYLARLSTITAATMLPGSSSAITKLETVTIGELYHFLQAGPKQIASVFCVATIEDILEESKWYYTSCSACKRKMVLNGQGPVCPSCNNDVVIGVPRFRFEASVSDDTGNAIFVVCEKEAEKLAGQTAAHLVEDIIAHNGGVGSLNFIPQSLKDVIGGTYKFQIRVSSDTLNMVRQAIIVTRIS